MTAPKLPPEIEKRKQELAERYANAVVRQGEQRISIGPNNDWITAQCDYHSGFDAAWALAQERIAELQAMYDDQRHAYNEQKKALGELQGRAQVLEKAVEDIQLSMLRCGDADWVFDLHKALADFKIRK